jgi:GDSL-like Lipase/Acylhydrolase family
MPPASATPVTHAREAVAAAASEPAAHAVATKPEAPACTSVQVEIPDVPMGDGDHAVPALVRGHTLAPFFEKVASLLRGNASDHIRIAVYGDSNLTMDFLSGQLRRALQQKYGDAGHGFVALGRPWSHYKHMDVRHGVKGNIVSYACSTAPVVGHVYGISGIAGESSGLGGMAYAGTAGQDAPIGHAAGRFAVYFEKGKDRGHFEIRADGTKLETVDGHSQQAGLGIARFELPDGAHDVQVVATDGKRRVRWLGLTMERDAKPSFVVDAFGVGSMNTHAQHRQEPTINHAMLVDRDYDLVIFATGANDVFSLPNTPRELTELIERHRAALPNVPVVLLTPSDRGRDSTFSQTLDVVAQRHQIAADNDVALWDLFAAMGGKNSMRAFKKRGFAIHDHIHMTQAGGRYLGNRLHQALWTSLSAYLAEHPQAGCRRDAPTGDGLASSAE